MKGSKKETVSYISLEYAQGGQLFDFIKFSGGPFSEKICKFYFKQLINGLKYLYEQGYSHRDLKPENLLFDEHFNLKIADFGFATLSVGKLGTGFLKTYMVGTERYLAPEIHEKLPYSGPAVDVFSAGIILFLIKKFMVVFKA